MRKSCFLSLLAVLLVSPAAAASVSIPRARGQRAQGPADMKAAVARHGGGPGKRPADALAGSASRAADSARREDPVSGPGSGLVIEGLAHALRTAWAFSAAGGREVESVVLVLRMDDGTYKAVVPGFTNERRQFTFKWKPGIVAIIHTHPDGRSPRPSAEDIDIADRFGIPMFTVSIHGMYRYDPRTRVTKKVLDGLEWLEI